MDKTHILVVDDDVALSQLVGITLEKTRLYTVKVENRSTNALTTARAFKPHLVLLDVDMPGMDGGEVAAQLRADPTLAQVPIIFFTSLLSQSEAGTGLSRRGGELYLPKPIDTGVLVRSLESVLNELPATA